MGVFTLSTPEHACPQSKRPLDAEVQRWPYEGRSGCGRPICVLVDSRPVRFRSFCEFWEWLERDQIERRFFHLQKGDCADASKDIMC